VVEAHPSTYEDFLPISVMGIFQSNLQSCIKPNQPPKLTQSSGDQCGLEEALGEMVFDPYQWYAEVQNDSLKRVSNKLGIPLERLMQD